MRRSPWQMAGVALVGVLAACGSATGYGSGGGSGSSNGGMPAANQVFMQGLAFVPATRTVSAGTTVQWVNQDGTTHTVVKDSGPAGAPAFDSGNIGSGGSFSVRFDTPGTYEYHCVIHGTPGAGMHGTIVVQ